jgi:hypothetical protein
MKRLIYLLMFLPFFGAAQVDKNPYNKDQITFRRTCTGYKIDNADLPGEYKQKDKSESKPVVNVDRDLEKLNKLYKEKILTKDEYEAQKLKILSQP